jgi:hypothetical protein
VRACGSEPPTTTIERVSIMAHVPVNSIEIPAWVSALCMDWYDGSNDMLYAVCSTGGLTTGTIRPHGCDTDEKWYLTIWREFSYCMGHARRAACKVNHKDAESLALAENWIDAVCFALAVCYGLEDWEGCDE